MHAPSATVGIVGFGFAGLATLADVVRRRAARHVVIVGDDDRGLGAAYATTDPTHLLNVCADRMGARADDVGGFAAWLRTPAAAAACRTLGVPVPGPQDFAPRALYGRYLGELRAATLAHAAATGIAVEVVRAEATALRRAGGGWWIEAGGRRLRVGVCVLALGHAPRAAAGGLGARAGRPGRDRLTSRTDGDGSALIVGTGLSAVDAVLTLRRDGFGGPLHLVSRHGLLPRAHAARCRALELPSARVEGLRDGADVHELVLEAVAAGHDWRAALDGLRPHTQRIWQRLSPAAQRDVADRWGAVWSAHRHRMAPSVAARLRAERDAGTLRVTAGRVQPADHDGHAVVVAPQAGAAETRRPSFVVDCTGATLDWGRSARPLVRGLVADGHVVAHPTGLGVRADGEHRVGPQLYAVGSALTGELWESVAVPELREQAATVGAAVAAGAPAVVAVA